MSIRVQEPVVNVLEGLERLAAYAGPWEPMRRETEQLAARARELRDREKHLDDVLVVALVGGSGVGKSTLLNALAGDQLAKTSEFRPCTSVPTVYHPPGARVDFAGDWARKSGSALEHLVLVDTPDSDTVVRSHRDVVQEVLAECDLILICATAEKYLDEATWSLLRPLQRERSLVCVETKAHPEESIEAHWLDRLRREGFEPGAYFRVNSRAALDRKLTGAAQRPDELDFPKLETFLREELTVERIQRIKRSNASGLAVKTVNRLHDALATPRTRLDALSEDLRKHEREIAHETLHIIERRLFSESHLWSFALGRELALRAKGIVGGSFRLIESIRSLPTRMAGWLPWHTRDESGRQAASLLTNDALFTEDLQLASLDVETKFRQQQSEVGLALVQAGFQRVQTDAAFEEFQRDLNARVSHVLRGPARDCLASRARVLSNWGATLLLELPPLAFIGYASYRIVEAYIEGEPTENGFVFQSLVVLGILVGLELIVYSMLARVLAWSARRKALQKLKRSMLGQALAFQRERQQLDEAIAITEDLDRLKEAVTEARG